jgi:hypothetical protein
MQRWCGKVTPCAGVKPIIGYPTHHKPIHLWRTNVMNQKTFSEKTQKRMDTLQQLLKSYEGNIKQLHQFSEGRLNLKNKGYTFSAENYERTPLDKQRLVWTINNLKAQIRFYQHELEVLKEYGC